MPGNLTYYAHGRVGEDEGYKVLSRGQVSGAEQDTAHGLLRSLALGSGSPSVEDTMPGVPDGMRSGALALIYYCSRGGRPIVLLGRPQADMRRHGIMTEGIVLDEMTLRELAGHPLRLLPAFSDSATIQQVERTEAEFATRAHSAVGAVRPLRHLLGSGHRLTGRYRQLLAAALTAFIRRRQSHVSIVLSSTEAHMALPMACGLDEILPPGDKARGFAVACGPVRKAEARLFEQLDWTVLVGEAGDLRFADSSVADLCDLRDGAEPCAVGDLVSHVEMLLARGPMAVETFGGWLLKGRGLRLSGLPPVFWRRLAANLLFAAGDLGEVSGERINSMVADAGEWMDRVTFQRLWGHVVGQPGALERLAGQLAGQLGDYPPLVGWLAAPEVLSAAHVNPALAETVKRAVEAAFLSGEAAGAARKGK